MSIKSFLESVLPHQNPNIPQSLYETKGPDRSQDIILGKKPPKELKGEIKR